MLNDASFAATQKHIYCLAFLFHTELNLTGTPNESEYTVAARLPLMHENIRVGWAFPKWRSEGKSALVLDLLFTDSFHPYGLCSISYRPSHKKVGKHIDEIKLVPADTSFYSQAKHLSRWAIMDMPACTCGACKTTNVLVHSDWCEAYGPPFKEAT